MGIYVFKREALFRWAYVVHTLRSGAAVTCDFGHMWGAWAGLAGLRWCVSQFLSCAPHPHAAACQPGTVACLHSRSALQLLPTINRAVCPTAG